VIINCFIKCIKWERAHNEANNHDDRNQIREGGGGGESVDDKREFVVNKLKLTIVDMKRSLNETQIRVENWLCTHNKRDERKKNYIAWKIIHSFIYHL
jgi:hypothetical protein